MAGNKLTAHLDADGKQFAKTLVELEAQLKSFQKGLKEASNPESFNRINRAITETKNRIAQINSGALDRFTKGQKQAGQAVLDFSRIVQDSPYVFLSGNISAIANNIDPFVLSLQRANSAAGGFGATMKAIGSSLLGGAGIGLLISTVTSSLVLFGDKIFGSSKKISDFNLEMYEMERAIDAVSESVKVANGRLDQLFAVAEKFIGIRFGSGFEGDLKKSELAISKLKAKIAELNLAERKAVELSRNASKDFTENASRSALEIANAFPTYRDIPSEIIEGLRKSDKTLINIAKSSSEALLKIQDDLQTKRNELQLAQLGKDELIANEDRKNEKKKIDDFKKYVDETISKAKELADFFDRTTIRAFNFEIDPRDTKEKVFKDAQDFISRVSTSAGRLEFPVEIGFFFNTKIDFINKDVAKFFAKIPGQVQDLRSKIEKEIQDLTQRNPILIQFNASIKDIKVREEKIKQLGEDLVRDISNAITNSLSSLAESIGNIFSGGDFGAEIFNIIGTLIQQIGKALMKYAIMRALLDKVLKNPLLAPATAFAIGAAAIALGQVVKNIKPAGARAQGGPVAPGQPIVVGEQGREVFVPSTAGRIVSNSAIDGGSMAGAQGLAVAVSGEFVLRNNVLLAAIAQATRSQNRLS